jgi:superfamily II DNA or RNA helicase
MTFDFAHDPSGVTLRLRPERTGLLSRLLSSGPSVDLERLGPGARALSLAIADLRILADDKPDELEIASDSIRMSHRIAAALNGEAAATLGLPALVNLVLRTDVEGVLGAPSFRLRYEWVRNGQRQSVRRQGAILQTSAGLRRLPPWIMGALDVADGFSPDRDDAAHWEALARFRESLDPGIGVGPSSDAARISMSDFLSGLEVRLADRFSIAPNSAADDFEVVPFSGRRLEGLTEGDDVSEASGELRGDDLRLFQSKVRERGALPAYRLGRGSFLVVDRSAIPTLGLMANAQRAEVLERQAFIANPRPRITAGVEAALRDNGALDGLDQDAQEDAVEAAAAPLFVETREFSERVRGIRVYEAPPIDFGRSSGTTWLPEVFSEQINRILLGLPTEELDELRRSVEAAIESGEDAVRVGDDNLPASRETLSALKAMVANRRQNEATGTADPDFEPETNSGDPIIVETKDNFDALDWLPEAKERASTMSDACPPGIETSLKRHQSEALDWQIASWRSGLPGILNADEQGLGKTLQTLAFLVWLRQHVAAAGRGGPVLVVAPTSLLRNWEQEADRHLAHPRLGHLERLYGSGVASARRKGGAGAFETRSGLATLDLDRLHEDIEEGRGHRSWILTTYTTLVNYQHSLARLRLSAVVFDEVQALKNPASLRSCAARALNADFRIGLTGTPIENSAVDLWAIMDQLAPGRLGTLQDFRRTYEDAAPETLAKLHAELFVGTAGRPPVALRRLKDEVASDLPAKTRRLHPRLMPPEQADAYELSRLKLANGGPGAALKMLHHIRSVSVHPTISAGVDHAKFIEASGRLSATFTILRGIAQRRERALVFIEHRQMQHRFIELARAEFGLARIDLINGDTPIARRQAIVNRFQEHLQDDRGFDVLVLGPKAAGVGLTLTAATHVIHLSRWWNPAVEEQCNDRVHRIGQSRPVTVHVPMAVHPGYREDSFDCLLQNLMQRKRRLARSALWPMGDTSGDADALQRGLRAGLEATSGDPLRTAMEGMYLRDDGAAPSAEEDGSYRFD